MDKIAVIGAGQMGNGIAHAFAQHDHHVHMIDVSQEALDSGMKTIEKNLDRQLKKEKITEDDKQRALNNVVTATDMPQAVKDRELVVEAASEDVDTKLNLFTELANNTDPSCILATNTSSISITKIAAVTGRDDKVIGMHFMNPVPVMKLIEVVRGYSTSDSATRTIMEKAEQLGKVPTEANDYPGFVSNRVLIPMINEAIYSLWQGVAGVKEIDTVMKLGMAHPMGPLQLADFIGLDTVLSILRVLQDGFGEDKYAPCPLLVNMVTARKYGVKSDEGFYDYSEDPKNPTVSAQFRS
jgi:3-hydroxybutyryl-CoA dehydrogenase